MVRVSDPIKGSVSLDAGKPAPPKRSDKPAEPAKLNTPQMQAALYHMRKRRKARASA